MYDSELNHWTELCVVVELVVFSFPLWLALRDYLFPFVSCVKCKLLYGLEFIPCFFLHILCSLLCFALLRLPSFHNNHNNWASGFVNESNLNTYNLSVVWSFREVVTTWSDLMECMVLCGKFVAKPFSINSLLSCFYYRCFWLFNFRYISLIDLIRFGNFRWIDRSFELYFDLYKLKWNS